MLALEDVLCELGREEMNEQGLPPGFRFHPTDEELITFYLASKVFNGSFCGVEIAEVDLNRCEPWNLPEIARMGEREWYFFSLRDKKYPTGLRTNRATGAGYWKATGKDREVYGGGGLLTPNGEALLIGMKKTLVFYKGRAPRGQKTRWIMHEYRLDGHFSYTCKDEWVICRIYQKTAWEKRSPLMIQGHDYLQHQLEVEASASSASTLPTELWGSPFQQMKKQHQGSSTIAEQDCINKRLKNADQCVPNFSTNGLKPSFAGTLLGGDTHDSSSSLQLFKSLFSHQNPFFLKQEKAPTMEEFHYNNSFNTRVHLNNVHNQAQDPFLEMLKNGSSNSAMGLGLEDANSIKPPPTTTTTTSMGFNSSTATGLQNMMMMMTKDPFHPHQITVPREPSWLLHP